MNYPKVSIIILNWNGLKDTIECLESLRKITYPNYEVIIVDNGSSGNDPDVLEQKYKDYIRLIRNKENLGFAGGINIGIKYAFKKKADYILNLNNDIIVEKNFLEPLVEDMLKDERIGITGPANYCYYEPQKLFSSGRKINWWKGGTIELDLRQGPKEVDCLAGCCLLIKKEVINKIGYFYKPYFLDFEETDYCVKAKDSGFKILCEPKSKVWHKIRATLDKIPAAHCYYFYRNKLLFMRRNAPFYFEYPFYIYFSLYLIFRYLENLANKNNLMAFSIKNALIDFWQGNFGKRNLIKEYE